MIPTTPIPATTTPTTTPTTPTTPTTGPMICLYIQIYYEPFCKEYIHIITTNRMPTGSLKNYIKMVRPTRKFSDSNYIDSLRVRNTDQNNLCGCLAITDSITHTSQSSYSYQCSNNNNLLTIDNIDMLVSFLIENGYSINKDITKIMNNDSIYVNNGKKVLFYVQCPNT